MSKSTYLWLFLAAKLLAVSTAAQAQGYDYVSVEYPGAENTSLLGVNRRGDVVGNGSLVPDNFPFVYNMRKGTLTDVTPVAGYGRTTLIGISDRGELVGSVFDNSTLRDSGLILDKNGVATVFNHPDAVDFTMGRAFTRKGQITGIRDSSGPFGGFIGFLYDPATDTFTDIVPSDRTIPHSGNSRGDVVGSAVFISDFGNYDDPCGSESPYVTQYGWLRTVDGSVTYFTVNGMATRARDISDSGKVAGFVLDNLTGVGKGFVAELDGTQCQAITIADEDLIQFPGAFQTIVEGISAQGAIVGFYSDDLGNGGGFIATPQ